MKLLLALLVLPASGACGRSQPVAPPELAPGSLRTTQYGDVEGFVSGDGAHVWRGIPYAVAPVGDLRWRAPRPPPPWPGTRESLAFGPQCVQLAGPLGSDASEGEPIGDEDCLYLNVFAPRLAPEALGKDRERLPVMFWIHGGGNTIGSADVYDGSLLAVQQKLVVVTVNYRLGVFGWFAHRALRSGDASPADRSGNFGTLDLVRALEWVRDDIAAFGGDPQRVTIFGESAGGSNVFSLLLSPAARGLFQRAIVQSGAVGTTDMGEAERFADDASPGHRFSSGEVILELLQRDGLASSRAAAKEKLAATGDAALRERLRATDAHRLIGLFRVDRLGGMYSLPRLLRDGVVLPAEESLRVFSSGAGGDRVPVILGTNRDENKLFHLFSSPHVTRLFRIPLWLGDERRYQLEAEYASLMWRATGVDEPATAMAIAAERSVYAYRFDWDEQPKVLFADLPKMLGAAHALEIPFVFGRLSFPRGGRLLFDEENRPAALELSRAMMSYWAQFAYTGRPGRGADGRLPRWKRWDPSGGREPERMLLDTRRDGGLRMSPGSVTREDVIRRVADDPRLQSWRERCEVYRHFVNRRTRMSVERYREIGQGACREVPLGS